MTQVSVDKQSGGSTLRSSAFDSTFKSNQVGVLVIEDERLLRVSLAKGLDEKGFAVWAASDGGEGVELYRRFGLQIDIVLSDVQMPVLDGMETLSALREMDPSVRCCFMTGDTSPSLIARLKSLQPFGLLIKPFRVAEVVDLVASLPSRSTSTSASEADCNQTPPSK